VARWGVAVVGWEWYQSTEEIRAVRMVPVTTCLDDSKVLKKWCLATTTKLEF
jgi:hypothetical protein